VLLRGPVAAVVGVVTLLRDVRVVAAVVRRIQLLRRR
jgi:hypothetical protein